MRRPALLLVVGALVGCTKLMGVDGDYSLMTGDAAADATGGSVGDAGGQAGESGGGGDAGSAGTGGVGGTGATGGMGGTGGTGATGGTGGTGATGGTGGTGATGGTAGTGGDAGAAGSGGVVSPLASMQAVTTSLPADTAQVTAPLTGVDLAKSFLVFNYRFDYGNPPVTQVSGQLTSPNVLTFQRSVGLSGVEIPIRHYVASFDSGVHVQRGSEAMTGTSATIALSEPVALDKAFPIVSVRTAGNYYGPWNFIRATLTSPSVLTLDATEANPETVVEWQVVSFDGASVQSGQVSLATADTTKAATMQGVDPEATWLLFTYTLAGLSGGGMGDRLVHGRVSSGTEVEFARVGAGAVADIRWYAVSFHNGSRVASGVTSVPGPDQMVSVPLVPGVDPLRTLALSGGFLQRGGSTNYSLNNPGIAMFTLEVGSGSALEARRIRTGGSSVVTNVAWSAVEFR